MAKQRLNAEQWGRKIKDERERLLAYCRRYTFVEDEWNIGMTERDIERCVRALSYAKEQEELAKIRESQLEMFDGQ